MNNIKILSVIVLIAIGNILLAGCDILNKNNNEKINQDGLSIYEYNDKFSNLYKKYIDPIYKEEYDDIKKFISNQGNKSNYDYSNEYKELLEIANQHLIEFKNGMNNLIMKDINLTKLNNKLVENTANLINEIELSINNISDIPIDKYSMTKTKFINYLEKNTALSNEIETKFEDSIKSIRTYLDIELNK
jgi:hypothetical protein